jgi:arylsulfatase A-like enzyme
VDRFDSFDAHPVRGIAARRDPKVYYRVASKTIDRALEWTADKSAADRFFVWIHVFDPHQYSASTPPPAEHLEAMRIDAGEDGRSALDLIGEMHDIPPTVRKRTSLSIGNIQRYDGQILFVDRELRRLFEGLAERGLTENSLWIVTADHGEGLGNHGYMYHGRYLYNEHLRVPLIFYSPRQGFPQRRISGPVTHVDILPTVAELMDLTPEPKGYATSGRSLVPLMLGKDGDASPRYVFSQRTPKLDRRSTFEDGDLYSIQDERFKYIYRSAGTSEFYDLELDPQELHNLIETPSAARDRLRTVLDERFTPRFHSPIPAEGQVAPVDPATREELRALGYIE